MDASVSNRPAQLSVSLFQSRDREAGLTFPVLSAGEIVTVDAPLMADLARVVSIGTPVCQAGSPPLNEREKGQLAETESTPTRRADSVSGGRTSDRHHLPKGCVEGWLVDQVNRTR